LGLNIFGSKDFTTETAEYHLIRIRYSAVTSC